MVQSFQKCQCTFHDSRDDEYLVIPCEARHPGLANNSQGKHAMLKSTHQGTLFLIGVLPVLNALLCQEVTLSSEVVLAAKCAGLWSGCESSTAVFNV